jgi:pimeloyl-ACP methyl ester carboxylesterase
LAFTHEALKGQLLDQNFIKSLIRPRLYHPINYPLLGNLLHLLLIEDIDGFTEAFVESMGSIGEVFTGGLGNEASSAIPCSDHAFRTDDLDEALPAIDRLVQTSRLFGDMMSWNIHVCAQWKLPTKERFERGFHEPVDTAKPLLIIGNEYDVVTPFISAQNASASFPDSALVKYNAHGHGIAQQPSLCTARMTRAYFEDGELPLDGTVCEPAVPNPWDPQSWLALFPELGYERKNGTGAV